MTALTYFEKLKIDIIIYFRMFSFSNDLKIRKTHIWQFWFLANFDFFWPTVRPLPQLESFWRETSSYLLPTPRLVPVPGKVTRKKKWVGMCRPGFQKYGDFWLIPGLGNKCLESGNFAKISKELKMQILLKSLKWWPGGLLPPKSYVDVPAGSGGSRGIKGGMGEFTPQSEACHHLRPPVRKIKRPKSAIFGNFLDFYPLRITFCPLNASHRKEKKIWCPHCLPDVKNLTFSKLSFGLSSHPSVYHFRKKSTQFGQIRCFFLK